MRIFLLACTALIGRRFLLLRLKGHRTTITATLVLVLLCAWLPTDPVYAHDPNKRLTQYFRTSWRIRDGADLAHAYAITQTSDGFLWLVSGDMATFDGVRFASWDGPPNYGSIGTHDTGFGQIVNVLGDRAGGLWVFGLRGIVHLKGSVVISRFELDGLRGLQNVAEDADGSVWVVRGNNSISDSPLCHVTDSALKCFGKADGILISPVNSLLADGKGGFWLGGQTALVHWHNGVSETYPIAALKSSVGQPGIAALARGPDGSFWIGVRTPGPGRGLGRLIHGVFQTFETPSFDGSKLAVHSMIFDRDGTLWVGTSGQGLFRIAGNVVDHYGKAEGLSSNTVDAVFEDREGILWTATPDGIDKFRDPRVASFSTLEDLGNDSPMGVLASRDGTMWVANLGSLDHIENNGTISSIRTGHGLPGNRVASLLEDRAGNLWVGVDDGLYLFKNGRFRRLPEPNHKPLGLVVGLTEDVDGNIWAECFSNPPKLVRIRDFQVREEFPASQVPTGRTLVPDPQGGIWIGTLKGDLALFRHGALEIFPLNTKGDPFIHQIIANADGTVLAGSAEGLVGLRQGKVQRMTTSNGLPCNFVTSFIQDKEKRWWLYTDCGIVELPDSELQRWWTNPEATVAIRLYDELDGAQAGRPDYNSAALSPDDRVWFASGVWIQMLDPLRVSQEALPAVTHIQSLIGDRKEFAATDKLSLGPHLRDLQIDYTTPIFAVPQRVKFRYRLDPYDHDWHEAGTRRQAFYTDLPPAKYSFRVIACNSDGVWNESAAKLDFSVAPTYYQTNWFRVLCVAAAMGLLWLMYDRRMRTVEQRHQFLERQKELLEQNQALMQRHQSEITALNDRLMKAQEDERTRIAGELHDGVLQQITSISLSLGAVKYEVPSELGAIQEIGKLQQRLIEVGTDIRQLSHELHPSVLQEGGLPSALSGYCEEFSKTRGIPVTCETDESAKELSRGAGLILYRIAQEALGNVAKHAQAKHVQVRLDRVDGRVRLCVSDDGVGCVPNQAADSGGLGLINMRERVRQLKGTFEFQSEPGRGTTIKAEVPFRAAS